MKYLALFILAFLSVPAAAQTAVPPAPYADRQLEDPKLEAQAKSLMETIRCLVCQSQSIADSNVSMAGDMRSQIRQRILAGEKPEHVRKWLVERYGDWVSYAPPVEPLTWPLWAMRSEEHTSELQSLMRISYAVFCLKKKTKSRTK